MRIGVIGLGIMGQAVVRRLLAAGHQVSAYNRTRSKADDIVRAGATWKDTPAELAAASDLVMTFVTDGSVLAAVTFAVDGILAGLGPDSVHADMSTIAPSVATAVAIRYRESGRRYIQSPVLGSKGQIESGTLLILAGGDLADIEIAQPAWSTFSQRQWRFETAEQSSAMKLACNTLIAQMIVGLGQSLAITASAGVDGAVLLDVLGSSALANPMIAGKGKAIMEGNFAANFTVRNLLKDLRLAADYAADKALPLPANALNRELFVRALADGLGEEDYSAVVKTILLK